MWGSPQVAIYKSLSGDFVDEVDEKYICTDLNRALGIIWHFWRFNELDPTETWEEGIEIWN
jgi:hypothetical protein